MIESFKYKVAVIPGLSAEASAQAGLTRICLAGRIKHVRGPE